MIQDDAREIILAEICGLSRTSSRRGIDATLGSHPFELKSTTTCSVTTARDAGLKHIARWRRQYWVIGKGPATDDKDHWRPDELFFAHPSHLEVFFSSVEDKIKGTLAAFDEALSIAGPQMDPAKVERMEKVVLTRAGTLNCPTIQMAFVRKNCLQVPLRSARTRISELVMSFPL